jgi:hypothetical protein
MNHTTQIISRTTPFLAAAGATLAIAGCGSSNHDNTTAGGNTKSFNNLVSDAQRYTACMRIHGVPSFPAPHVVINTPGKQAIGIRPLPQSIASSPQFKAAREACKGIMPGPENGSPKEASEHERARARYMLAFARCLRSHGVQGFPDPTAQGQLTLEMVRAAGVDLQAPAFLTAGQACVGVTHGAITLQQLEQAIHHPAGSESAGGGEGSESHGGGGEGPESRGGQ